MEIVVTALVSGGSHPSPSKQGGKAVRCSAHIAGTWCGLPEITDGFPCAVYAHIETAL